MFDTLLARLDTAGYDMYELSNFAKPGRRAEHNMRYWTGRPYLGLGPSAHSYLEGARAANPADLVKYGRMYAGDHVDDPFHVVRERDLVFERVFMALRLREGLHLAQFETEFGRPLDAFYPGVADRLAGQGWLLCEKGHLRLAPHAWFVSDGIFSEFAP
jgi:oxygen-independent coproporphyrinogen-3 oxidase